MVFFADTTGGCNTTTSNPLRTQYAPLQQLALDLQNDQMADYTWITPNQFNDQHSGLANGYGGPTGSPNKGDRADIAQGDNFLARIVPLIMASDAYKDHGVIVLWWDESEGGDTPAFTLPFIIISRDAHENVKGLPLASRPNSRTRRRCARCRRSSMSIRRRVIRGWAPRLERPTCRSFSSRGRSSKKVHEFRAQGSGFKVHASSLGP
jgi:hypothetical protein